MTSPSVTSKASRPARTAARALLPEPLGPMMGWTSPALTFTLLPLRISRPKRPACRLAMVSMSMCIRVSGYLASRERQRALLQALAGARGCERASTDAALQADAEQLLRLDRELHRQGQGNLPAETPDAPRDPALGREGAHLS